MHSALFSSDGSRYNTFCPDRGKLLLYYSKRSYLGECPKFELWVFTDGGVLYKEVYADKRDGEIRSALVRRDIDDLARLLECSLRYHMPVKKPKDLPIAASERNEKELEYRTSTADDPLRAIDVKIGQLLGKLHIAELFPEESSRGRPPYRLRLRFDPMDR